MRKVIKSAIPSPIRLEARNMIYRITGAIDLLLGKRNSLIPPVGLMYEGPQDYSHFIKSGEDFLRYYIELCDLRPDETILDVGCGMGRKTIPLINYLDKNGRYEGIDINKRGINWCKKRISKKHPNFHFQLIDVFNKKYNPKSRIEASSYRFPFANEYFDFIVLGSVFTHMLSKDMENYFSEISRVLKQNGRCLITFFLLNEESSRLIADQKSSLTFNYEIEEYCLSIDLGTPEQAICYDETFILNLYDKYRLEIKEPIYYGLWCERDKKMLTDYQDIIIAKKLS